MSVSLTEPQVHDRSKTVTRRLGWRMLKPGDTLTLCRKVQGRERGEPLVRICDVRVVRVRREQLAAITDRDVVREGFAGWSRWQFIDFLCRTHRGMTPESVVTRIEWEYLDAPGEET